MSNQPGVAPFTRRPQGARGAGHRPGDGPGAAGDRAADGSDAARPRQLRRLRLAGTGGVVARCRDFTREALSDWGWIPAATEDRRAAVDDVLLVVSELVTNACLHAGGPDELRLLGGGAEPGLLRIEVSDPEPAEPSRRDPHMHGRPGGHGMFIVDRLSVSWGVTPHDAGKTVWADMRQR